MVEKDDLVSVPRKAIELILDRGCFQDEGPEGEGWTSPELQAAIDQIKAAMGRRIDTVVIKTKNPAMTAKTIYHQPQIVKMALFFPTLALLAVGFICGLVAALLAGGFNLGYNLSRSFLMLADLEK